MITLKNERLTVNISELGAEIKSVVKGGVEYMWDGRPEVWSGTAPIMFPICGGLKDDKFIFEGKEYTLKKHGYARNTVFEVENVNDTSATFLHRSSEKTKESYPFDYELRIKYTLEDNCIKSEATVENKSDKAMYFNIGFHEAYYTPEGIEEYDVVFDENETLSASTLCGPLLSDSSTVVLKDSNVLPLYDRYFAIDALVFKDGIRSHAATLRNRRDGRAIRVEFPNCDHFLIWHKYAAPYICLEPWNGIPDVVGSSYELTEKEGITALDAGQKYLNVHTVRFM